MRHEERRVAYLSEEAKIMTSAQDDLSGMVDELPDAHYQSVLQQSQLAGELRRVYEDLQTSGIVHLRINNWILVSCCLPQKIYHLHDAGLVIEPSTIDACMEALRPFHAILLLNDKELINNLPLGSSPALKRLVNLASPLKSLETLAGLLNCLNLIFI